MIISKSIVRFDFYAVKRNILLILIPISILVLLFVLFAFTYKINQHTIPLYDKSYLLQYYQSRLDQCLDSYNSNPGMNDQDKRWLLEQIAYYRFYISTGTVEWNYLGLNNISSYVLGYDGASFSMYAISYLKYFYYLLVPFVFVYFINNNHGLSYKNILMSKEKRSVVFNSRLFSAFIFTFILFLVPFIVLTICFFTTPTIDIIFYFNSSVTAVNSYVIFLAKYLTIVVISYLLSAIAVFFAFIFKKWLFGYVSAPLIYAIFISISALTSIFVTSNFNIAYESIPLVFPFDSLESLTNYGFTWQYMVCVIVHIVLGIGFIGLSSKRFERTDF